MLFPAEHPHSKMARRMLHTFSFLTTLALSTQVVESNPNSASGIYCTMENALIADSSLLYMIQEVFIPSTEYCLET